MESLTQKKAQYWNEVARRWQEAHPKTFWRAYNDAVSTSLFESWLPSGKVDYLLKTDLFDEALGKGLYSLLVAHAKSVVGIDISILITQAAKLDHNGLLVTEADVRHLPFANGTFDIIVSNSTLDHFESRDEIIDSLGELQRVLRTGGQLLLTLDNLTNPIITLRSLLPYSTLNRLKIVPYYVGHTLGARDLCHVIKHAGFEVHEVQAVMHFPRILTMLTARILERVVGQSKQERFLRFLTFFEHLSHLPTRFLTGHYIAVKAIKK